MTKSRIQVNNKIKISFDLDEVLFVSPATHKTEKMLPFPLNKIFIERLRYGAPRFRMSRVRVCVRVRNMFIIFRDVLTGEWNMRRISSDSSVTD